MDSGHGLPGFKFQRDHCISHGRLEYAPLIDQLLIYGLNTAKVCVFAYAECPTQDGRRPIVITVTQIPTTLVIRPGPREQVGLNTSS